MPALQPRALAAQESVFARTSREAAARGAVNLGQGFPAAAPPAFLLDAARAAVGRHDQYTPPAGLPALREALGAEFGVDPADVLVTSGATEGLQTLALALYPPGGEVLTLEPAFDVYGPQAELAGARAVPVMLALDPQLGWRLDLDAVARAVTPRTCALLLNTPHNPTGLVFTPAEVEALVALARAHDLWIVSDEVYDELYFGPRPVSPRALAPERTFVVGSAGKRLEATGWRVGWVVCPPGLASSLAGVRQLASFCAPTPLQWAVAWALPVARKGGLYGALRDSYAARLDTLAGGLEALGVTVFRPGGSYFLTAHRADWSAAALMDAGVAAIPVQAFCSQALNVPGVMRLAFCKSEADLALALERLATMDAARST
ncbi:pyridoxal phosphate-dependent aminotransferase [Deinococcus ficus]|uniref:pyridoxal phosphate-dependent aminotransferase n=1 Tax=Deinococcus ficus TaxID=317577 RepID=UPI0003B5A0DF|nr:aminotransferase class I/II-fold pyridoxal phosphate-dependent enzyme [Deinococcus ficus]